jgi:3-methyladenine DNA glycosylase AlkD
MDEWAAQFNSWDLCDQVCGMFTRTGFAESKIPEWAKDRREFVRRAAFALMAEYAVHAKKVPDKRFVRFLPVIERYASDNRNFVKKAVNWALRQIGKRSPALHGPALAVCDRLARSEDPTARWIGRDAARELRDPKVLQKLERMG